MSKVSIDNLLTETLEFFGSQESVKEFLNSVAETGSIALSVKKTGIDRIELSSVLEDDETLKKLIDASVRYAIEVAEGTLYERAVHGYDEEMHKDEDGSTKKRYSDRALIDFLRANSIKYANSKGALGRPPDNKGRSASYQVEIPEFKQLSLLDDQN